MEAGVDWNHVHKAIRHVASGVFMGGRVHFTCILVIYCCLLLLIHHDPLGKKIAHAFFFLVFLEHAPC